MTKKIKSDRTDHADSNNHYIYCFNELNLRNSHLK